MCHAFDQNSAGWQAVMGRSQIKSHTQMSNRIAKRARICPSLVTGHLLWPVHVFGTHCLHCCIWWMTVCFKHLLKAHLFLAVALSDFCLFSCTMYKFSYLLTYLLTYLLIICSDIEMLLSCFCLDLATFPTLSLLFDTPDLVFLIFYPEWTLLTKFIILYAQQILWKCF